MYLYVQLVGFIESNTSHFTVRMKLMYLVVINLRNVNMQLVSVEKKVNRTEEQLVGGSDSGLLTHGLAEHQLLHDAACPAARTLRYCAGAVQGAS